MRRRHGFTLVELLIVIGIITVLIAILLPVLNRAREQARQAVCASNQHQICLAVLAYANQNQGWLPRIDDPMQFHPDLQPSQAVVQFQPPGALIDFTRGELMPYVARDPDTRQRIFSCPSDPDPKIFINLATGAAAPRNFSYSLNRAIAYPPAYPRVPTGSMRLTQVRQAEHKILVMELDSPGSIAGIFDYISYTQASPFVATLLTTRHSGLCNEGFFDGHVELIDPNLFNGSTANGMIGLVNDASKHYFGLGDDQ